MLEVPVSGFCLVSVEVDGVELVVLLGDAVLEELPGDVLVDDELEAPGVVALMSVVLEDELVEGAVADPFRFTSVELDELVGAVAVPFTFTSVELDELAGADALPFRLMSVELDEVPGVEPLIAVEDELEPGTTAMPGVTSVVVMLLDCAIGTLGTQPAGVVFAVSVHFGSRRVVLVIVSARAVPKAASIEAARRLMAKVVRFMCVPPFGSRSTCGTGRGRRLRFMVRAGPPPMVQSARPPPDPCGPWVS